MADRYSGPVVDSTVPLLWDRLLATTLALNSRYLIPAGVCWIIEGVNCHVRKGSACTCSVGAVRRIVQPRAAHRSQKPCPCRTLHWSPEHTWLEDTLLPCFNSMLWYIAGVISRFSQDDQDHDLFLYGYYPPSRVPLYTGSGIILWIRRHLKVHEG